MDLQFAAQSVAGRRRTDNEDCLLCCPELGLWAVADGMGGHHRGEVASALAVKTLREAVQAGHTLLEAVYAANTAVSRKADEIAEERRMGTTLVAVHFTGQQFAVAWVGDSRAYRVSAQRIEPLTQDHSWVQSLVDAGEISAEQARKHPKRHVILQCLGQGEESLEVGYQQGQLAPQEVLVLCSDGLTGELDDRHIQHICASANNLEAVAEALVAQANAAGGRDNITCIVLGLGAQPVQVTEQPKRFIEWLFQGFKLPKRDT